MAASEKKYNFGLLIFSAIFLVLAGSWGWQGYKTLSIKAEQQQKAITDFRAWRAQYTALLPIQKEWEDTFMKAKDVKDIYSLYSVIAILANTNPDRIAVDRIDRVQQNGMDIGLSRICLTSMGEPGLILTGESPALILGSVKQMLTRKDMSAKQVVIRENANKLEAVLIGFCIVVSD